MSVSESYPKRRRATYIWWLCRTLARHAACPGPRRNDSECVEEELHISHEELTLTDYGLGNYWNSVCERELPKEARSYLHLVTVHNACPPCCPGEFSVVLVQEEATVNSKALSTDIYICIPPITGVFINSFSRLKRGVMTGVHVVRVSAFLASCTIQLNHPAAPCPSGISKRFFRKMLNIYQVILLIGISSHWNKLLIT